MHPYCRDPELESFCGDQGIVVTAYAPFAGGAKAAAERMSADLQEGMKTDEVGRVGGSDADFRPNATHLLESLRPVHDGRLKAAP
jgi:hypothetical protein